MSQRVRADSLVTLHYRLATDDGREMVSTFGTAPATLQLGNGELAPSLEACLVGLAIDEHQIFALGAAQAFGERRPQLVRRLPRSELPGDGPVEAGDVVEIPAPDGAILAGRVCEVDETSARVDFNHPLAGRAIRFEAHIVGVL